MSAGGGLAPARPAAGPVGLLLRRTVPDPEGTKDRAGGRPLAFLSRDRSVLARRWLVLAVLALSASGLMALGVVASRIPGLADYWPTDLANRLLVVHVDLGILVWFLAIPLVLVHLQALTGRGPARPSGAAATGPWLSGAGAAVLLAGLLPGLGTPHPVNYVPLVAHPLYVGGLVLFLAGVAATLLDPNLLRRGPETERPRTSGSFSLPRPASAALAASGPLVRLGGAYLLLALVTLTVALVLLPPGTRGERRSELLMWGPGHVLQYVNVGFVLVAWMLLAAWWKGRSPTSRGGIRWTAVALGLSIPAILLLLSQDPGSALYRTGFTRLMQWGLFPAVLLFLALVLGPHLRGSSTTPSTPESRGAGWALLASITLMLAGFLFGAFIRGPDLRIPGHYHACIGAVTLAYMALTLLLLPGTGRGTPLGWKPGRGGGPISEGKRRGAGGGGPVQDRALLWIAGLYGAGQLIFSTGLFVAGSFGLGRKLYGVEQQLENLGQGLGLAIMGIGGVLALAGGVTWAVTALRRLHGLLREKEVIHG